MQKPLISIIVPVYNAEKYLSACLQSICKQEIRELEIIVVDDGSIDDSGKIADEYAEKDSRVRVVHERNGNPGATRNVGLALATGEYVGFIDADDWIESEMYLNLYQQAKADQADIVVTGVSVEFTLDKYTLSQRLKEAVTIKEPTSIPDLFFQLKKANLFAYPVNKIYRKNLVEQHAIRFPEVLPYEDLIFNLEIFKMAKIISVIPDTPYHYMRRDELSAAGAYSPNHLDACKLAEESYRSFFIRFAYPDKKAEMFLRAVRITDYFNYTIGFYKKNCPVKRKERLSYFKKELFENRQLYKDLNRQSPVTFYERMFYFFLQHTTPEITDFCYLFLFFLRRNCTPLYRRFRKIISN